MAVSSRRTRRIGPWGAAARHCLHHAGLNIASPRRTFPHAQSTTTTESSDRIIIDIDMDQVAQTPQRSPLRRVPGITQTQKQALVDNLQLESRRLVFYSVDVFSTNDACSHRESTQITCTVCSTGSRTPRALGTTRQPHPTSFAKTQHPRTNRRASRQITTCSSPTSSNCSKIATKADGAAGTHTDEAINQAEKVCLNLCTRPRPVI